MAAISRADATWEGDLTSGGGRVKPESGAFPELPITWASRAERQHGKTSPEELVAAAHAACFSMAFSNGLAKAGHAPERLRVSAEVTFDKGDAGWRVTASKLSVRGRVPGMTAEAFRAAAEAAKDGCPISQA